MSQRQVNCIGEHERQICSVKAGEVPRTVAINGTAASLEERRLLLTMVKATGRVVYWESLIRHTGLYGPLFMVSGLTKLTMSKELGAIIGLQIFEMAQMEKTVKI